MLLAGLLTAAAALPAAPAPETARPPNILLVIADDLGVDVTDAPPDSPLSVVTPTLDRLRAEGVTFTTTWSNPVCSPTRATMLTGRYAFRTGVTNAVKKGRPALPLEELTLPEALDLAPDAGYAHAAFGKWHLGNPDVGGRRAPNLAGFAYFAGSPFGANPVKSPDVNGYSRWTRVVNGESALCEEYRATRTVDDALEWIAAMPSGRPWFAWFGFCLPHVPISRPPESLCREPPAEKATPAERTVENFRAMVEAMDAELGRLLRGVRDSGAPTVVIFVGDNGTDPVVLRAAGDRGARGKGLPFEGGVRVPLVIAGAGVEAGGRTCDALVNTTDLFATVLDLAGVPADDVRDRARGGRLDAVSLVPHLVDPDAPGVREHLFNEVVNADAYTLRAARDRRFKLVRRTGLGADAEFLFDLDADPAERRDLLAEELSAAARGAHARLGRFLDVLLAEE